MHGSSNPMLPASNLREFVAFAKKQPGKTNVGIPGATGQFVGDALWKLLGISTNNVNYKGSSPAEIAVLSGEMDIALLTPLASMQHLNSGRMRALGITSVKRSGLLPTLPTVRERMVQLGFTVGGKPPTEFTQFFRAEVEKFRKRIIESGVPLI